MMMEAQTVSDIGSVSHGPEASSSNTAETDVSHGHPASSRSLIPHGVSHSPLASSHGDSASSEASYVIIAPEGASPAHDGFGGPEPVLGFNVQQVPDSVNVVPIGRTMPLNPLNDNIELSIFSSGTATLPVVDHEQAPQTQVGGPALIGALPMAVASSVPVLAEPIVAETAAIGGIVGGVADIAQSLDKTAGSVQSIIHDVESIASSFQSGEGSSIPSSAGALQRSGEQSGDAILPMGKRRRSSDNHTQASSFVKLGDNSVITDAITSSLCSTMAINAPPMLADFCRVMVAKLPDLQSNFQVVAHQYTVRSTVYSSEIGGRLGVGAHQDNVVFRSLAEPLTAAQIVELTAKPGPSRKLGTIELALLDAYMQGGNVSERFVVSALQPKLNMANMTAARFLSEYLTSALEYCDNHVMYAKLLYQAMVYDIVSELGLTPAVIDFPQGGDPAFVNLDDANLDYLTIAQPIVRGDIILVDRLDYTATDLQILFWLAKAGRRATDAEAVTPHCVYVQWPAINVTVLNHGAAPAAPQAAVLTPSQIYAFVAKMANARGEASAAMRGMYLAMDMLGVVYNQREAVDNGRYHFRTSLMSFHSPDVVMPRDYNVLLRLLHIRPVSSPDAQVEYHALTSASQQDRVRLFALYSSTLQAMSTTVLYDMNITHGLMTQWGQGAAALPPMAAMVIQKFSDPDRSTEMEAPMFTRPKALFPTFIGCQVPTQLYPSSTWLGNQAQSPGSVAAMADQLANRPPNNASPLSIDNWLLIRPMEWGISGPNTSLDISKEIMDVGNANMRGWRAVRGSEVYDQRVVSSLPIPIVAYGIQVLNAILNDFRWIAAKVVTFSQATWSPGRGLEWNPPAEEPDWQGHYIEALHVMQPCTVMTYDYARDVVMAPALMGPQQLTNAELRRLYNWRGQEQSQVGFYQSTAPPHAAVSTAMQALSLEGMFGGAATASVVPTPAAGVPPP